jgi:hypothetical protein
MGTLRVYIRAIRQGVLCFSPMARAIAPRCPPLRVAWISRAHLPVKWKSLLALGANGDTGACELHIRGAAVMQACVTGS